MVQKKKSDLVESDFCGEGGIRTLGGPEPTTVFETVPFNHSGTSPNFEAPAIIPENPFTKMHGVTPYNYGCTFNQVQSFSWN